MSLLVNGTLNDYALDPGNTLDDLVQIVHTEPTRLVVEHNGTLYPKEQWPTVSLANGDAIEILHFMGGGCYLN